MQYPNVGPVFSSHEIVETAVMQVALESAALETALPRHTDQSVVDLAQLLEETSGPESDFPALNVRFHLGIVRPSPYQDLAQTIHSLLERAARYVPVRRVPGYRDEAQVEHHQMDAVRDRDLLRLKESNEHHVTRAARRLADRFAEPGG